MVRDLYADAEQRLLALVARQLEGGFEALWWAVAKLRDIQPLRRAAQGVVDALGTAMQLEVFSASSPMSWHTVMRCGRRRGTVRIYWKPYDGLPFGRPAARIFLVASRLRRWMARNSIYAPHASMVKRFSSFGSSRFQTPSCP